MKKKLFYIVIFLSVLVILFFIINNKPKGKKLFEGEGCMNCHNFKGEGGGVGPDLTEVTNRRSDEWIRDQLNDARVHYPDSPMPSFAYLSDRQKSAIIKYLKTGVKADHARFSLSGSLFLGPGILSCRNPDKALS